MTQTTVEEPVELGPDFLRDPYPFYVRLREQAPVVRVSLGPTPVWLAVGYDAARAALTDPRLVKDPKRLLRAAAALAGMDALPVPAEQTFGEKVITHHLLSMNPRTTPGCATSSAGCSPCTASRACGLGSPRSQANSSTPSRTSPSSTSSRKPPSLCPSPS